MGDEVTRYALILERIGRNVLNVLQDLPEVALNWVPPLAACHSLLDDATELIVTAEGWLDIVGHQRKKQFMPGEILSVLYTRGECSALIVRYARWLDTLHERLDEISDLQMETVVAFPPTHRIAWGEEPITIRKGFLRLIEYSAYRQGKIHLLRQIYLEAMSLTEEDRMLHMSGGPL